MIESEFLIEQIYKVTSLDELETLRISLLGRQGKINLYLKELKDLSVEDKKNKGEYINKLKIKIEEAIAWKNNELNNNLLSRKIEKETIDPYLPAFNINIGKLHILNIVLEKIVNIFQYLGYTTVEGPEIESEYYNFEALNMPAHHPARDMWDTLYLDNGLLLRTHTSPVQIRTMQSQLPPIKIIAPGKCYRKDSPDASHSSVFHQIEGLYIDKGLSFAHLKGTLEFFAKSMFGKHQEIKLHLSYFPFVEPGAELSVKCLICKGKGCATCKETGWLEILGAGMVHPEVLEKQNINAKLYSGFAFGMGIERITMLIYEISHIKNFLENDLRFLSQFKQYLRN